MRARSNKAIHLRLQSRQKMKDKQFQILLEALTWRRFADRIAEAFGKTTFETRLLKAQANRLAHITHEVFGADYAKKMRLLFTVPRRAVRERKKPRDKRSVMAQYKRTLSAAYKVMGIWL